MPTSCARWTDALFSGDGPKETPEERRLRHAACLISDIGWRAHPDYRGEQSLNVIAHAGLAGIDHPGRIFLALSVYFRHDGQDDGGGDDLSERLKAAVSKRAQKRARIIGAAVRTAHMLSIGMPGVIDETPLELRGEKARADPSQGLCGARRRTPQAAAERSCRTARARARGEDRQIAS